MTFSTSDHQQNNLTKKLIKLVAQQQDQIVQLKEHNVQQQEYIKALKAEILRLKKLSPKPDIKPNTKPSDDHSGNDSENQPSGDSEDVSPEDDDPGDNPGNKKSETGKPNENTRNKRKKPCKPPVDDEPVVTVPAEKLPPGSTRNGHVPFYIQEVEFKAMGIRYKLEQWITPDGKTITARPPKELHGHHFGPVLQCLILHQYFGSGVTQPQIKEWLWDIGISISAGEVNNLIIHNHEEFHAEKDEILATGIRCSHYLQTDDTGARHQGQNGYCTYIGNELFAWYGSTHSKSRVNFFDLLHRPYRTYTITEDALVYLKEHSYPKKWQKVLRGYIGITFISKEAWKAFMDDMGLTGSNNRRKASEALIYASLIHHGFSHNMTIFSDGAPQFNIFNHAQCWFHAERPLCKVIAVTEQQVQAQFWCRTWFWAIYRDLKAFKAAPSEAKAEQIRVDFHALIHTDTGCKPIQDALEGLAKIEKALLKVLDDPGLPLHNNLSESQIREHVKRRKISGGTRSDAGRHSRDTFASLKKTCRLYGLSFWDYLKSRLMGDGLFPRLSNLIEKASRQLPCGGASSF